MAKRSLSETCTKYPIQLPMQYQTSGVRSVKGSGQTISMNSKTVRFISDHDLRAGLEVCLVISWPAYLPDGTALNLFMFGSIERSLSLVDGKAVRSCITPIKQVAGRAVTTLEGLGTSEKPDAIPSAFIAEQAAQCGYCTNGMIMSAKAVLTRTPHPTLEHVKQGLAGNLCRCGTHTRILSAVMRAAKA